MNAAFLKSFQTLNEVYVNRAFSSIALNRALNGCAAKDKALVTKIVYGVLDNDIKLTYVIGKYVRKLPKGTALILLKMGAYCLTELSIPSYAVVNDMAELAKITGDKYVVGFVNATLKRMSQTVKDFGDYPADPLENASIRYSYPLWALKKLVKDYGKEQALSIVSFPPEQRSTVRFTADVDTTIINEKYGVQAQSTPFNDAFYISGALKQEGRDFTAQSLSSMCIARICAEKLKFGKFLDCCAAPGGKSVYVKQLCPNSDVTSCDVHPHRVELINAYANRMQVELTTRCLDMSVPCSEFANAFDVVLCDVPCSGFGVLNNRPDIKLFRNSEDLPELMHLQYSILRNCSNYVKKGGYLVYSTCTVFDNENGQNVRKFLKEHDGFEYSQIVLPEFPNAHGKGSYQFLPPIDGIQGFFVAVFKRMNS